MFQTLKNFFWPSQPPALTPQTNTGQPEIEDIGIEEMPIEGGHTKDIFEGEPEEIALAEARISEGELAEPEPLDEYAAKMARELENFREVANVHDLPEIYHYWSNKYLIPLFEECGFSTVEQFFAMHLLACTKTVNLPHHHFISIGSGNGDLEVAVSGLLREAGLENFTMECLEINPAMTVRGRHLALQKGLTDHMLFTVGDFNTWHPEKIYSGIMANHSLHHVTNLEGLFGAMKGALHFGGKVVVSDMIGRNGHQRWPEALEIVQKFWEELPETYRYNRQLNRYEEQFMNWDCAQESFEGIRAQDILPLLVDRFDFETFIGFTNVTNIFVDRGFGHNFDPEGDWDRAFIDRVHATDEANILSGHLKPTQMLAVMTPGIAQSHHYARGLSPRMSVRDPRPAPPPAPGKSRKRHIRSPKKSLQGYAFPLWSRSPRGARLRHYPDRLSVHSSGQRGKR